MCVPRCCAIRIRRSSASSHTCRTCRDAISKICSGSRGFRQACASICATNSIGVKSNNPGIMRTFLPRGAEAHFEDLARAHARESPLFEEEFFEVPTGHYGADG